ncbi:VOC family protein [Aquabacter cavernae]|uniref:VOC family protein n=1 Tax=Aquabacter cavernae TaxID=2496029 RepID=UPI000F8E88CF|nr:VOC family protein [Aquabacter cavernae]
MDETLTPALRLTLVTLGVGDLARAIAFYDGLGLVRRARKYDGVAFFEVGGAVLSLFPRADLAADAGVADTPPSAFSGVALACNLTSPQEVDALLTRAAATGGRLVKAAQAVFWGGYSGYFADPDGHLWEVAFNPFTGFDVAGNLVLED